MARAETTSNISHTNLASSVNSRTTIQQTKDPLQRSDIIKTEFHSREGLYKISSLIDNLGKIGTNTCLNEPVKITLMTRLHVRRQQTQTITPITNIRMNNILLQRIF